MSGVRDEWRDDPSVLDSENLWRRIHPAHIVPDANRGSLRPSSAAFGDSEDGSPMSVYLSSLVQQSDRRPADLLSDWRSFGLASIGAGNVRLLHLGVVRDPLPEEPAHGLVTGPKPRSVQRKLAKASTWVILPSPTESLTP